MNDIIVASLAVSGLFAAFLMSFWTLKAFEPKEALTRVTVEHLRYKKAA